MPLLLITGLGFGPEIFQRLCLKHPLIHTQAPLNHESVHAMKQLIYQKAPKGCHVMGWSLGGLLAIELKKSLPHLVHKMVLVAVRDQFETQEIQEQLIRANADPAHYLRHLYKKCFIGQKKDFEWFKRALEEELLKKIPLKDMVWGLEYLASHPAKIDDLKGEELLLCYGAKDIIAPPERIPPPPYGAKVIILPTGHLPFLHADFSCLIDDFLGSK